MPVWLLVPLGAYLLFSTCWCARRCRPLGITNRSVAHILRPPGYGRGRGGAAACAAVILERGLRTFWVIGGAMLLAWIWELDLNSMAGDTTLSRLMRGGSMLW